MDDGSYVTKTYTYDDLASALNRVQPYDWNRFLRQCLDYTGNELPEHGIDNAGWKLVYDDTPSAFEKSIEKLHPGINFSNSLGISVSNDGTIRDVQWGSVAAKSGLVPNLGIVAINGKSFTPDVLKDAIIDAHRNGTMIQMLVKNNDQFGNVSVDYRDGLKYPHLVRGQGKDLLEDIVMPKK
jgi:Predicted protease with the C-terminal PDZ domain